MIPLGALRVLLTTFGFDEGKIIATMRMLAYDKLVVITGQDSLQKKGYNRLLEIESGAPNSMETIVVDVFDFMDCFRKVDETIAKYDLPGNEVILNISGGTKVLSDAALLAGFQNGIRTFHCEEDLIELPVIIGFSVTERFTPMQRRLLREMSSPVEVKKLEAKLSKKGYPLSSVQRAVRELKKLDILGVDLSKKGIRLYLKESHQYFREALAG
ncbi:MAG: DUF6293 family protein [Thermoplasmata archaeon]